MRGNDLLAASCDVMVTDTLTGNLLVKILSAFTTGGDYESIGLVMALALAKDMIASS